MTFYKAYDRSAIRIISSTSYYERTTFYLLLIHFIDINNLHVHRVILLGKISRQVFENKKLIDEHKVKPAQSGAPPHLTTPKALLEP